MNKSRRPNQESQRQPSSGIIHASQTIYKGQLPPPDMLEKFEAIEPGFTHRLLKMVEDESLFKGEQDRYMFRSFKISAILGLGIIFAFLSVIVISSVAVYAIYSGFGTAAASIMATCVVGVIIAFIQ